MPEHSPAPTPHRAVYGFAIYMLFFTLFILYTLWALLPTDQMGLTYLPDKYFALLLPVLILGGLSFFIFFIYPGINTSLTPNVNELPSIVDPEIMCRMRGENAAVEVTSWEQLMCHPTKFNDEPSVTNIETIDCKLCDTPHEARVLSPISTLRFMDLEEVNYKTFGV